VSVYATDVDTGRPSRQGSWLGPSNLALIVVLLAAGIGALSLARQRSPLPPLGTSPPAWSVAGHDAARTAHSRSYPAADLTLRWTRALAPLGRPPVVDGAGNAYLARADGALLSLSPNGDTRWCAAVRPITDTACTGPQPPPGQPLPAPVAPSVTISPDNSLFVVDGAGELSHVDTSSPNYMWKVPAGLIPSDGIVLSPDSGTLYGVVPGTTRAHYAVAALRPQPKPSAGWASAAGWRPTVIHAARLTPVSVAPDGTPLVVARAADPAGAATLDALDAHGGVRWQVSLAPGRPSYATIETTDHGWIAWVAVTGTSRSWVIVVDDKGRVLWRWPTLHVLDTVDGGFALSLPSDVKCSPRSSLAYVSSEVGVYALDRRSHHPWLFFDTRRYHAGIPGAPSTDVCGNVYVATDRGYVYSVALPSGRYFGRVRWSYDTGRDARGALALDPGGNVLVPSRGIVGTAVVESLGSGGAPLATAVPGATAMACAGADCPTPTPTLSPTVAPTASPTITPTLSPAITPTLSPTIAPPTATISPTETLTPIP